MIEDLEREIARIKEADKLRSSAAHKQTRSAVKALEKALPLAREEEDGDLIKALEVAIAALDAGEGGAGPVATGGRVRRTAEQLEELGEKLVDFLRENPRSTIGEIAEAVGESTKEVRGPILGLMEEGRISKTGERRGTRYSAKGRRR